MEKLAYSVDQATEAFGIGRTHMFDLLRSGEIRSVKSGRRRLIPAAALEEYLDRLIADQTDGDHKGAA